MSGYSGTPLARKLGIEAGHTVALVDAPDDYDALLAPLPPHVRFVAQFDHGTDMVHLFATDRAAVAAQLATCRAALRPDAVVWVSWPKRAAKVPTDVTEQVVRDVALPLGFVDVKVCAVDEVWSGLKLVVRRAERGR